jgi:class 3 adenylate cyclase
MGLYIVEDELYMTAQDFGTMKWNGTEFTMLDDQDIPEGETVSLVGMQQGSFPAMDRVTYLDHINEEMVLTNVENEGISILDRQRHPVNKLGTKGGLPDREILQVMIRKDQEIWILSHNSLHKINFPSPLKVLDFLSEKSGRILTSLIMNDIIYVGTSHGIFKIQQLDRELDRVEVHKLNKEFRESIHLLSSRDGNLFAAGFNHIYVLPPAGSLELIDEGSFTGIMPLSSKDLIASNELGIIRYQNTNQGWQNTLLDPSLASSHSFVLFDKQVFFLCGNGIYRLTRNRDGCTSIPFHMDELLYRLIPLENELYLVGNNRVYLYERNEDTFLPLPKDQKAEILYSSDDLVAGENGEFWIIHHDGKYRSRVIHTDDLENLEEDQISYPVLQNLGEIIKLSIKDSLLYFTGRSSISLFDLRQLQDENIEVPLRIERFDQGSDGIELYLAGLEFQSVPEPLFRHKLIPQQEEWSRWTPNRSIEISNLRHGEYRFEAQARDLYGRNSDLAVIQFTIEPPIYLAWFAFVLYGFLFLIALFLLRKWRLLSYQRAESRVSQRMQHKLDDMALEKAKSDKLVAEVIPENTATQLRSTGKAKWDKYERATVLFSDIQGFTQIAEEMNPESLIDELDKFFFHFDSVVEKYQIEKIKTIGDAYMAAGGIPEKNSTNPVEVVLAALEMQSYMQQLKSTKAKIWDLRIGIHTGPVIAGVVGHKKVSYDIWGDTVNTASRMESSGTPGKVNISGITYSMVKDYFMCEYRGKLPVKYKGNIDMYYVNGLRPELAVDLKEIPNKRFFTKLQLLRLGDLEDRVFEVILPDLPDSLHFHKLEFARKVYNQSFLLCRAEEIDQDERLLVRTAALMLYTGLTQSFNNFENRSSVICREILPGFKYSESQIDQICNLILATKMPFNPNTRLEKILIDARMEYIGRPDFTAQLKLLYQELLEAGMKINGQQFKNQQLELLYNFEFFTVAGQRLREVSVEDQMAKLEQERWI